MMKKLNFGGANVSMNTINKKELKSILELIEK